MHIKEISRKRTLSLAIALVLASGMGQAMSAQSTTAGEICAADGASDVCNEPAATLTTSDQGIDTGTGTVTTANIVTGAGTIDGTEIANSTITSANIAADSVGNSEMQDNAIGNAEMRDNAIGSAEIQTGAVGNSEVATDAIGNDEMQNDSIGTDEIIDGSITGDDLGVLDALEVDAGDPFLSVKPANIQFGSDDGSDSAITTMTDINANTKVTDGGSSDFTELNMTATSASLLVSDDSGGPHVNGITINQTTTTLVGGTGTTTVVIGDDLDIDVSGSADIDVVGDITATGGTVLIEDAESSLTLDGTDAALTSTGDASMTGATASVNDAESSLTLDGTDAALTSTGDASMTGATASVNDAESSLILDGTNATLTTTGIAKMTSSVGKGSVVTNTTGDATMTSGSGLSKVDVTNTSASVTVDNGVATHGLMIDVVPGNTTLSGGTGSTTLTLNDSGAHLDNNLDMGGNQINNLAPGTAGTDAVNRNQLNAVNNRIDDVEDLAKEGIAAVAAMAAIPGPIPGKRYSVGIGAGFFKSESAVAIGFNAQVTDSIMLTASAGATSNETAGAIGASFSW